MMIIISLFLQFLLLTTLFKSLFQISIWTTFLQVVFLDSSGEIGFSDNFFAKVVKKEVIKNRYFMVSLTVGGKGGVIPTWSKGVKG